MAKERVFPEPRPPNARLTSASPLKTGISLGGIGIRAIVVKVFGHQSNKLDLLRRHAAIAGSVIHLLLVAPVTRSSVLQCKDRGRNNRAAISRIQPTL